MDELVQQAKWLSAAGCFGLALTGCTTAKKISERQGGGARVALCTGNAFASGVLLAASLVHMLPDAMAVFMVHYEFPIAPCIAGCGFCFLVFIGEVIGACAPKRCEPHTHTDCVTYEAAVALWPRKALSPPEGECCDSSAMSKVRVNENKVLDTFGGAVQPVGCNKSNARARSASPMGSCHSSASRCRVHMHSDAPCRSQVGLKEPLCAATVEELAHQHGHAHSAEPFFNCHLRSDSTNTATEVKSFLLFAALSFHSVMEGLGLGSAQNGGVLLTVAIAILAHKGLAAFALGCTLTKADMPPWKFWTFVLIFSTGTPFGCIIASFFVANASQASQGLASAVCVSLASGTFLQVATLELLPRVLAEDDNKALATTCLSFGFIAMSLLAIWC
mmetsp:Transcript_41613/g.75478  ORF Transcript_41613/g.75478 Transcript_41613/m.75478 type:complete len:390 (+) Transcript_41613:100-1269(+)